MAERNMRERPVYLDYQATTPVDPRVLAAMLPYFTEIFGNPHSTAHAFGREAEAGVETARAEIATLIGADTREIVFTSGATESNNLAILGAVRFRREHHGRDHVVTAATEHKSVLASVHRLESEGARVTFVPVRPDGLIDPGALADSVDERTALVTIMAANNEIGVVQPLAALSRAVRAAGAWFHTDAAQAVGKVPIDVEADGIDLLSISGHKLYGPKGIGALYVRRRPRIRLEPLFQGGGQERGLRSGTLPTPLCVALGKAAAVARAEMDREAAELGAVRERFLARLRRAVPDLRVNGSLEHRLPGNLNLAFPAIRALELRQALPDVAVSTGSACTSASVEPSYVLRALGLPDALADGSIRVGFGRFTTETEADYAADRIGEAVAALRASEKGSGQGEGAI